MRGCAGVLQRALRWRGSASAADGIGCFHAICRCDATKDEVLGQDRHAGLVGTAGEIRHSLYEQGIDPQSKRRSGRVQVPAEGSHHYT